MFPDVIDATNEVLDAMGRPAWLTIPDVAKRVGGTTAETFFTRRKNHRVLRRYMAACGYERVPNPTDKSGKWKIRGVRRVVYADSRAMPKAEDRLQLVHKVFRGCPYLHRRDVEEADRDIEIGLIKQLNRALDALGRPEYLTVPDVALAGSEQVYRFLSQKHPKIKGYMNICGYRRIPNPREQMGRWRIEGRACPVYGKISVPNVLDRIRRDLRAARKRPGPKPAPI